MALLAIKWHILFSMIGLVGQLAARGRKLPWALPRRLPMNWAFPMIGLVGHRAACRLQVALPGRLPMDWPLMAIKCPLVAIIPWDTFLLSIVTL